MLLQKTVQTLVPRIFDIRSEKEFNDLTLQVFRLHWEHNPVYHRFVHYLKPSLKPEDITHFSQIPFLPIDFFKTQKILLDGLTEQDYFMSSGTTSQGAVQSRHYIADKNIYGQCFLNAFRLFWGEPQDYVFLALLPNYLEQPHSSLICMMKKLIELSQTRHPESGFYLYNTRELAQTLRKLEAQGTKTMLFGVSFALLDLAENFPMPLRHTLVLETGGMKGRRREMVKEELHQILKNAFQVPAIHSEYGMCELFSQAYSTGKDGRFLCPPWMKILIRNSQDPLSPEKDEKTGGINVIDLGNICSCPFIATQDLGKNHADGSFEVLGRFDNSDIRGCNLMVE
ncbi:MAG: acyltransferase [Bacteroides sp.]|nr:acyltransferase [Bacteroides sp.]MCM1084794.1 acyltransferase [Bacteroides sp.]MCM1168992.1 acyltransferase [Bacteroides sp.]